MYRIVKMVEGDTYRIVYLKEMGKYIKDIPFIEMEGYKVRRFIDCKFSSNSFHLIYSNTSLIEVLNKVESIIKSEINSAFTLNNHLKVKYIKDFDCYLIYFTNFKTYLYKNNSDSKESFITIKKDVGDRMVKYYKLKRLENEVYFR